MKEKCTERVFKKENDTILSKKGLKQNFMKIIQQKMLACRQSGPCIASIITLGDFKTDTQKIKLPLLDLLMDITKD